MAKPKQQRAVKSTVQSKAKKTAKDKLMDATEEINEKPELVDADKDKEFKNGTVKELPKLQDGVQTEEPKNEKKETLKGKTNGEKIVVDEDEAKTESEEPMEVQEEEPVQPVKRGRGRRPKNETAAPAPIEKTAKAEKSVKKRKVNFAADVDIKKPKLVTLESQQQRGNGSMLVVGQGDVGQLGLGDVLECSRPRLVQMDKLINNVCAGGMHTVCLTEDGEIYTFGCNDDFALGRDTSEEGSDLTPGKVDIPEKVVQISAGDSHTAVLTETGKVYSWGSFRDSKGPMGFTTSGPQPKPLQLLSGTYVKKIASGSDHLILLDKDGTIYSLGCSEQGQLGRVATCFTDRGGRRGLGLLLNPAPIHFPKVRSKSVIVDDVWATSYATFARSSTGDIYVCGLNNYCQLGLKESGPHFNVSKSSSFKNNEWVQIAGGQHHTLALDKKGDVYALGRKDYGRLGLGEDTEDKNVPTQITQLGNEKCVDISCGGTVSFAVSESGKVYAWGMGTSGQLGQGNEDDLWVPTPMASKQLGDKKVVRASGGGQHTVILAVP